MTVVARVSFLANEVVGGWVVVEELVVLQKWVSALGGSLGSLGLEKMMVEKFDVLQKWKSAEHLHFQKESPHLPRLCHHTVQQGHVLLLVRSVFQI